MKKYAVKLMFIYSDIVHVEATDSKEAERLALGECQEEFEKYYDCETTEE
jgi:hypothetical protein